MDQRLHDLLGRQYSCRFRVVGIQGPAPGTGEDERRVLLHLNGDHYIIAAGELMTLIDRGFVMEEPRVIGGMEEPRVIGGTHG
jgi:hypothetical protein